jgi:LPS O-antigen subunit length determinant protein (WzzB/FepE family)
MEDSQQLLERLFKDYQFKHQLISTHQRASIEKSRDALAISELILDLNYQIQGINKKDSGRVVYLSKQIDDADVRLAGVERDIADDFKIVDLICQELVKISEAIEVRSFKLNTLTTGA